MMTTVMTPKDGIDCRMTVLLMVMIVIMVIVAVVMTTMVMVW
jgi:hypothetical protein